MDEKTRCNYMLPTRHFRSKETPDLSERMRKGTACKQEPKEIRVVILCQKLSQGIKKGNI